MLLTAVVACSEDEPRIQDYLETGFEFSECKNEKSANVYENEAVEYRYLEGDKLKLIHKDMYFNCCQPENNLMVDTQLLGDSIIINEYENEPGLCHCICPYDMECTVSPLQKKEYWVIFKNDDHERFRFLIDFKEGLEGEKSF